MNIANATEFNNFIKSNEFFNADPVFGQLNQCLDTYLHKCNCYNKQDKIDMYNKCNSLYYSIISGTMPKLKSKILAKIGDRMIYFYDNNRLIGSIGH